MYASEEIYEKIELYINGQLPQEEQTAFEQEINTSQELADEVRLFKELKNAIFEPGAEQIKSELKSLYAQNKIEGQPVNTSKNTGGKQIFLKTKQFYYVAASLLLIAINAVLVLNNNNNSYTDADAFVAYYTPYEYLAHERTEDSNVNPLHHAIKNYEKGAYKEAIATLEGEQNKERNSLIYYYKGLSYLAMGESSQAIDEFNKCIQFDSTLFTEPAMWYMALAYIKEHNREKASSILTKLAQSEGRYSQKADELNQALD